MVCRAREAGEPVGEIPWALTREELDHFVTLGLRASSIDIVVDDETPPVRRFRAFFERP